MKKLALLLFLLFTFKVDATTYYLDAAVIGGADNGTSWANAWDTLAEAQSGTSQGDTIYLRNGDYGAFVDSTTVRTDWITYKAEAGQTPVFTYILLGLWTGPYDKYLHFEDITIGPGDPAEGYRCVFIHLSNYVRLRGCTITGNNSVENAFQYWGEKNIGISILGGTAIEVNDCNISDFRFGIKSESSDVETDTVQVMDCNISNAQHAVTIWGVNWTVSDNNLHDLYSDGIIVSGRSSTVKGNTIHDIMRPVVYSDETGASYDNASKTVTTDSGTPYSGWDSDYVQFLILTVDGTRVSGTAYEVSSFDSDSITLKSAIGQDYPTITKIETTANYHLDGIQTYSDFGSWSPNDVSVLANNIHEIGAYTWSDAQGIWSGSSEDGSVSHDDMVYENNLVYDIYGPGRGVAFFGTHRNLIVRNNTLPNERLEFIYDAQCDDFSGNLCERVDFQQRYEGVNYDPITPNPEFSDYNVVRLWWVHIDDANFVYGDNSVEITDEGLWQNEFVDYDGHDYQLAADSNAVNIGAPYAPITDILGVTRDADPDAGAYEYVSSEGIIRIPFVLQQIWL